MIKSIVICAHLQCQDLVSIVVYEGIRAVLGTVTRRVVPPIATENEWRSHAGKETLSVLLPVVVNCPTDVFLLNSEDKLSDNII